MSDERETKTEDSVTSDVTSDQPPVKPPLKGILKRVRDHPNKRVDFNLKVECIPFDPSKDFTVEIKIVEKIVHIKSWAVIMEQRRREAEEAAKTSACDTVDESDDGASTDLSKRVKQRPSSPVRVKKKTDDGSVRSK